MYYLHFFNTKPYPTRFTHKIAEHLPDNLAAETSPEKVKQQPFEGLIRNIRSILSNKLRKTLTIKTPLAPLDAIAQLGEALGLDYRGVIDLFPKLKGYKERVKLDITKEGDFISIEQADGRIGTYRNLYYGYDLPTGESTDLIGLIPNHPDNTGVTKAA